MKIKKILIIFILMLIIANLQSISYGANSMDYGAEDLMNIGKEFIEIGENNSVVDIDPTEATNEIQKLAGILWGIGIFTAVVVGMIIGIKLMWLTPTGRAEVLKTLAPYLIGVVLVVGGLTIWRLVINILNV